jgi:hypothetical protein
METTTSAMSNESYNQNEIDDLEFDKALKEIGVDVDDYEESTMNMMGPRRDIGPRSWW